MLVSWSEAAGVPTGYCQRGRAVVGVAGGCQAGAYVARSDHLARSSPPWRMVQGPVRRREATGCDTIHAVPVVPVVGPLSRLVMTK